MRPSAGAETDNRGHRHSKRPQTRSPRPECRPRFYLMEAMNPPDDFLTWQCHDLDTTEFDTPPGP